MTKLKNAIMYIVLLGIIFLACMSIYGAFIGPDRAKALFNSLPLALFWILLTFLLVVGFFIFISLTRRLSLFLMHAGCVMILIGALTGSQTGHQILADFTNSEIFTSGVMPLYEGYSENRIVLDADRSIARLPFEIKLNDFRTEYYQPGNLYIYAKDGRTWKVPANTGDRLSLGPNLGTVEIVKTYQNCKIKMIDGKARGYEGAEGGSNPAVEVLLTKPDGSQRNNFVFERFAGHPREGDNIQLIYKRSIKDWISDVQITKDGKPLAQKNIEVNHPLHFAGYHFYQSSYDPDKDNYTVLRVTSDLGLSIVFTGDALLIAGLIWHFWLIPIHHYRKTKLPSPPAGGQDGN